MSATSRGPKVHVIGPRGPKATVIGPRGPKVHVIGPRGPKVHVIGNVNVDLIMGPLGAWPQPGTENILAESALRVGGSAGNAALAFQALGVPFRLACNVGDDVFGRWLREPFRDGGPRLARLAGADHRLGRASTMPMASAPS